MQEARPWIPEAALYDGVIQSAFSSTIREIANEICTRKLDLSITFSAATPAFEFDGVDTFWSTVDGTFHAFYVGGTELTLAEALLGIDLLPTRLLPADWELISSLADMFTERLLQTVTDRLDSPSDLVRHPPEMRPSFPGACAQLSIALPAGQQLIAMSIAPNALVSMRKHLVEGSSFSASLGCKDTAVNTQRVQIGAQLGSTLLSLREFKSLAEGDVLILDRMASAPLELSLNGRRLAGPTCTAVQDGSSLGIKLYREIDGAITAN